MKKTLAIILALVMCLTLVQMSVFAAHGNEWIQMEKSNFDPNEPIRVIVTGITASMAAEDPYVSVYKKGAAHDEFGPWFRLVEGRNEVTFLDHFASGDYEMRLYRRDYTYRAEDLVSFVPFTVGRVAKQGTIALDKVAYTAFDPITVSVSGITAQMVTAKAFVSIYEKGARHDSFGEYHYVTEGSGSVKLSAPNKNGDFEMRLYSTDHSYTDDTFVMSVPFTVSGATGSSWAQIELEKANALGLIPDRLKGQDLTRPITRAEFAAVAVLLYQNLTGKTATPTSPNPFTDTNDTEVLKAHRLGIIQGVSATRFAPNDRLTREQMAAMMTRTLKTAYIDGWTLANDGNYRLNFTMPQRFNDDALISGYARESVYFMASHGIIQGSGGNFRPRQASTTEAAITAATSTREQAIAIAVRMVENLKDKPLNYR